MSDRTKAYEALVAKTGLDPAVARVVDIKSIHGRRCVTLRPDKKTPLPGGRTAHFVEDVVEGPIVQLPVGWEKVGMRFVPLVDPQLRAAPDGREEYWERSAVTSARIAFFAGRLQVAGGRENGWFPIIERLVVAIAAVIGQSDAVTLICQVTFGMLNVSIRAACEDPETRRFVNDLGPWAEAVASERCMVSGEPGSRGPINRDEPWEYVLSARIRALEDPLAHHLLYPRPPEAG